jgi:transposase
VNWQPISEMPLIAGMIDGSIKDTRAFIKTLTEARYSKRPHVMDDATVDRIDRVHTEQLEFVDIYVLIPGEAAHQNEIMSPVATE